MAGKTVRSRVKRVFSVELPSDVIPIIEVKARLQGRTVPDYIRETVVMDVKNLLVLAEMMGLNVRGTLPGRSRALQSVPATEQP